MEVKSNKGGQLTKEFVKCWGECSIEDKIKVHNIYTEHFPLVFEIFKNDKSFLRISVDNPTKENILSVTNHGKYNHKDRFAWFGDNGLVYSGNKLSELPFYKASTMVKYFTDSIENLNLLKSVPKMSEFVNKCVSR